MRINGRTLRPSNLAERRLLLSFGATALRVPRHMNPFTVARRLRRVARGDSTDMLFARELAAKAKNKVGEVPNPSPDFNSPVPFEADPVALHGQAA